LTSYRRGGTPVGTPVHVVAEGDRAYFRTWDATWKFKRIRNNPEAYDENYIGGDIAGGVQDWRQLIFRPVPRLDPYATGSPGIYLCSASTPPGGGVHGMSGHLAAKSALRHELR
jgi:phytoene dehydrogenase-like protein